MPIYLQRARITVRTKKQFLAGTNSPVKLCYRVEEKHVHPKLEPGVHSTLLDHPWHDDFKSGESDSYEIDFGTGRVGKNDQGQPILNGLQFHSLDDAKDLEFFLRIEGNDRWVFDRLALGGYFVEVRPKPGPGGEFEEVELGWLEMATIRDEVEMSADPDEGFEEYPIELNGSFQ